MSYSPDLPAYFKRIGFTGSARPDGDALRRIVEAHTCTIPFENLDVLLGKPVSLEPADIEAKFVRANRGGYCFEQNGFLLEILRALGFRAAPLSARVRIQTPREVMPPRTHLFVRVDLEGTPYLCDVGIGALSPGVPLRLDRLDEVQPAALEPRRIVKEAGRFFHQVQLGSEWTDVYEFTLEEMPRIDRELGNYWTSTHPSSRFKNNLVVARAAGDGTRFSILNSEFTHRRGAEILERRELKTRTELFSLLAERFDLRLPDGANLVIPRSNTQGSDPAHPPRNPGAISMR